jgi:hypothetical protein
MTQAQKFASTTSPDRRRWLRFSLRTFLLVLTALCIWLGVKVNQARRQKEAVEALLELGATVRYAHQRDDTNPTEFDSNKDLRVPGWLRRLAGDDFFQTVALVEFSAPVTDEDLVHLAALSHIERLHVSDKESYETHDISDAGFAHLPRPDKLTHFGAANTRISDAFLTRLAGATQLQTLHLSGTRVTDEGLRSLPQLPKLKYLGLSYTSVGDAGLKAAIRDPSSIEILWLEGTQITDASLALLKDAKRLVHLSLDNTRVTDAGLRHLWGLPALLNVSVGRTEVTADGTAALKKATPTVRVRR